MAVRSILFLLPSGIAVATVAVCCGTQASLAASGEAPWCIIDDEGNLHCWYASSEACLQQIASGSRGFCVQNPSGASAAPAEPRSSASRRKKR
jgi:Protein of unknown function (DUF3551)